MKCKVDQSSSLEKDVGTAHSVSSDKGSIIRLCHECVVVDAFPERCVVDMHYVGHGNGIVIIFDDL